jgi:transcriptional regulator of acetoin/glycerol metabolism
MPPVEGFESAESSGDMSMETMEQAHIRKVLEHCQWNRSRAARELGIGYNTLWRKMKKYGIEPPD